MAGDDGGPDRKQRLDALMTEIRAHPAAKVQIEWEAFARFFYAVFCSNENELTALLRHITSDPDLSVELMQNVRPPEVRNQIYDAFAHRLHNYAAAAIAVGEVGDKAMKSYEGTQFGADHVRRKRSLNSMTESILVRGLRNILLHDGLPRLMGHVSLSGAAPPTSRLGLSAQSLLPWPKWKPKMRTVLKNWPDDFLDLTPLVAGHARAVREFTDWMLTTAQDLQTEGRDELNALIERRNKVLRGEAP